MWGHSFSNKEHQAGIRKRGPIRPNQFAAHCNVYLDQLILRTVSTQDYTLFGQDKVQKSKSKLHAGGCLSRSIIIYKWFTSAEKAGYCSPHYTQSSRTGSDRRLTTASFIRYVYSSTSVSVFLIIFFWQNVICKLLNLEKIIRLFIYW